MVRRTAAIAAVVVAGILIPATGASAQSVSDQYVPQLDKGGVADEAGGASQGSAPGGTGGGTAAEAPKTADQRAAELAPAEVTEEGSDGGGSVGGFPVTPFVGGVLLLLALALVARFARPLLQRAG